MQLHHSHPLDVKIVGSKTKWHHPHSMESWQKLVWDATVVDTLAASYLPASATRAGATAGFAEDRKNQK